jgi:outer membrane receptor protein involved in Fe transport
VEALEDGYWVANSRLGIANSDHTWSVYLWAKNLFDETYRTQVLFSSVGFGENYSVPRTYGIGTTFSW